MPESLKVEVDFFIRSAMLEAAEGLRDHALERAASATKNTRSTTRIAEARRFIDNAEAYEELMEILQDFKSGNVVKLNLVHTRNAS